MVLNFFDYIFYKVYKGYINWGESDIPGVYALCVITLFPCLNISSLFFFGIDIFKITLWNYDKAFLFFSFLAVMILNYVRIYKKIGLANLIYKWDNIDKARKNKLGWWMMFYLVISVIILFISILY